MAEEKKSFLEKLGEAISGKKEDEKATAAKIQTEANEAARKAAEERAEAAKKAAEAAKVQMELEKKRQENIDKVAKDVIKGVYGNGEARKEALTKAGYDYHTIQTRVNEMLNGEGSGKSIDDIAKEVIRGNWGNGEERKEALTKAGYDYHEVQARVNELLK